MTIVSGIIYFWYIKGRCNNIPVRWHTANHILLCIQFGRHQHAERYTLAILYLFHIPLRHFRVNETYYILTIRAMTIRRLRGESVKFMYILIDMRIATNTSPLYHAGLMEFWPFKFIRPVQLHMRHDHAVSELELTDNLGAFTTWNCLRSLYFYTFTSTMIACWCSSGNDGYRRGNFRPFTILRATLWLHGNSKVSLHRPHV